MLPLKIFKGTQRRYNEFRREASIYPRGGVTGGLPKLKLPRGPQIHLYQPSGGQALETFSIELSEHLTTVPTL